MSRAASTLLRIAKKSHRREAPPTIAIRLGGNEPAICPAPVPPMARDPERRTTRTRGVSWAVRRLRPPRYETAISQCGPSYSDHERARWSTHNL